MKSVSVIVPVYNTADYLERCVNSILEHDFGVIEVILVDDGSNDGSEVLCDGLAERLDAVKTLHQENRGPSSARNAGIGHASGEYIMFVDSDDLIDGCAVKNLFNMVGERTPDVITGNILIHGEKNIMPEKEHRLSNSLTIYDGQEFLKADFMSRIFIAEAVQFICRREFIIHNGIKFPEGLLHEDEAFTMAVLLRAKSVVSADVAFYNYMKRKGSITQSIDKLQNARSIVEISYILEKLAEESRTSELKHMICDHAVDILYQAYIEADLYKHEDIKLPVEFLKRNSYSIKNKFRSGLFLSNEAAFRFLERARKGIKSNAKIAYIYYPSEEGTGGYQVQKRNEMMLRQYSASECFLALQIDLYFWDKVRSGGLIVRAKSVFRRIKRLVVRYPEYLAICCRLKRFGPDMVFVDNSLIQLYGAGIFKKYNTVYFFHNVESEYARQQYPDYATDRIHSTLVRRIEDNERKICKLANACICLNERDSNELKVHYNRSADCILKTSIEDRFKQDYKTETTGKYLLFVGSDFFGNTQGLFWFIENCLDQIESHLVVVGRGMERYSNKYSGKNVRFTGFVDDLGEYYKNASCVVLPIISGSGMKTKTCEALMYGKTIIGTDEAFEGYDCIDEIDCIRCNSANEFIEAINSHVMKGKPAYSETNRIYYMNNCNPNNTMEKLKSFLDCEITRRG